MVGSRNSEYQLVEYPFLFPRYDADLKVWLRQERFDKAMGNLIKNALDAAEIDDQTNYRLHDLRRSLNLHMRRNNFTGDEASYILGHTLETNERNYLSIKDQQEIMRKKANGKIKILLKIKV